LYTIKTLPARLRSPFKPALSLLLYGLTVNFSKNVLLRLRQANPCGPDSKDKISEQ
jgi:hypothetical protein